MLKSAAHAVSIQFTLFDVAHGEFGGIFSTSAPDVDSPPPGNNYFGAYHVNFQHGPNSQGFDLDGHLAHISLSADVVSLTLGDFDHQYQPLTFEAGVPSRGSLFIPHGGEIAHLDVFSYSYDGSNGYFLFGFDLAVKMRT